MKTEATALGGWLLINRSLRCVGGDSGDGTDVMGAFREEFEMAENHHVTAMETWPIPRKQQQKQKPLSLEVKIIFGAHYFFTMSAIFFTGFPI